VAAKVFKRVVSWAAFVAAVAFFWGGAEAVLNYFWWPAGTWWGERVLASAFQRSVFYAAVVAAVVVLGLAAAGVIRLIRGRRPGTATTSWPGRAAVAAAFTSNVGWLIAGLDRKGVLEVGRWRLDLREAGPFFEYWIFFIVLAVAFAVLLAPLARRRRWRFATRWARAVGSAGFVILIASYYLTPALRPKPNGPNIVLIYLDAWRADAFREELMPNLYAYAKENATVYRRVWSCAPWTYPSMATAFTGRYPDEVKLWPKPRAELPPTVAELLAGAGYDTTAFVGNAVLERYTPLTAGFDDYVFWDWLPGLRAIRFYHTNWYCPAIRKARQLPRPYSPATSRVITDLAADYLSKRRRRPFFLWVHYMDPHAPYKPPPGYYLPKDRKYMKKYRPQVKKRRFAYHRLYEGECSFVDDLLPRILTSPAVAERTVVIVTADHGEEFWEHKTWGHGKSVYETVTRVPLIVSVPGEAAAVTDAPTSQIDLAPTVLRFAGVEPPAAMRGKPLAVAGGKDERELLFIGSDYTDRPSYTPARRDAVVFWPWKLILRHNDLSGAGEYYDLQADPGEQTPLEEDERAAGLRKKLRAWKRAVTSAGGGVSATDLLDPADLRALGYIK